jgi:hypothetical protein
LPRTRNEPGSGHNYKPISTKKFDILAQFYPEHVEREDKTFLRAAMNYLNAEGQGKTLQEFRNLDYTWRRNIRSV